MSSEFTPQAPRVVAAEDMNDSGLNKINRALEGKLLSRKQSADEVYGTAINIAEDVDTREGTSIPFRKNAVAAACLLTIACIRGAQTV